MASRTRKFFLNALSLTATALLIRGVSVIFNVYVSNKAGSEAMGLFSLLGSIYSFSLTLATAGINLGTTRIISDALAVGDTRLAKRSAAHAIAVCSVSGIIATILLLTFAEPLSLNVLGDSRAIRPLRVLALTLTPVALSSCLSGYFTAVRRVKLNASFGIISQFVKIIATVLLLGRLVLLGTEQACIALVIGGAIAEFFSLALSLMLYLYDKRKLTSPLTSTNAQSDNGNSSITRKLLSITLPVTLSACIRSALSMLQHILIPKGIEKSGKSWGAALSSYGALHGMALPLLLFPSAILMAFSGLLIPEISECCAQKDTARLERTAYRTLSLSLFFSIGVSCIMLFFSTELGLCIYSNTETAQYIRILAPLVPVMYIDSAVDAILKGSGHHVYSMNVNIADTLTACIFALTLIPRIGIWGYIISIYATEILNTTLSLIKMFSVTKMRPRILHQIAMPILCAIGATNLSKLVLNLLHVTLTRGALLTVGIILASLIYVALLFITKTVGGEEREFLFASTLTEKQYIRHAALEMSKKE